LDRIFPISNPTPEQVEAIFRRNTPSGSEGPLRFMVEETGEPRNSVVWANVVLYGDLRDFGSDEDTCRLMEWIRRSCKACEKELKCLLREAVIQIDVEGKQTFILSYYNAWRVLMPSPVRGAGCCIGQEEEM